MFSKAGRMTYLLFPGRHHLLTAFQSECLAHVIGRDLAELRDVEGKPLGGGPPIDTIVWAITSANHENTLRNPLPANRREVAIEALAAELNAVSLVYAIDDLGNNQRFAEYVLKKIEVESRGKLRLTPANTVVACSTPAVIAMYERLGFRILPMELADRGAPRYLYPTPWELVQAIFAGAQADQWRTNERFLTEVAPATQQLFRKYDLGDLIADLFRQPFLTADGDLTETRDYNTYVRSFDSGAERKYALVKDFVKPGRIVDIGCCTGSLLRELTLDDRFRESDFYGIEVARRLFQECLHRKEQGAFANDNVFFYQRNAAADLVFPPNSIHTFLTFALTHELESYQSRATLVRFMSLLHEQLALGGRWINVDVVGPENGEEVVYLWLNQEDGRNDDYNQEFGAQERDACRDYLQGLSSFARFLRFQRDFRRQEGYQLQAEVEQMGGASYVRLRMRDACEFISKKDYVDNWHSEMHETFCFWSFSQWAKAVEQAGFTVQPESRAYANPWIVENRLRGKVEFFQRNGDRLEPLPYPVSNLILIAEKR
jgi:trans-aconitate methyltransferase